MSLFESKTELFWIIGAVVLVMSFANALPVGEVPLMKAGSYLLSVPLGFLSALMEASPVLAVIALLAQFYYFRMLFSELGDGIVMIAMAGFLAVTLHVGIA